MKPGSTIINVRYVALLVECMCYTYVERMVNYQDGLQTHGLHAACLYSQNDGYV